MTSDFQHAYRIGKTLFRPDLNLLQDRSGRQHSLTPKSAAVLLVLVKNPQRTVKRETLLQAVWPGQFRTDDVLTHAITQLRRALGDGSRQSQIIETIPRVGYRMLKPVTEIALSELQQHQALRITGLFRWGALAACLLAAAVLVISLINQDKPPQASFGRIVDARHLPLRGDVLFTTPAPATDRLAIVYHKPGEKIRHLAVSETSEAMPVPLLSDRGLASPAWSPDESELAVRRWRGDGCEVLIVNRTSGKVRQLTDDCDRRTTLDWSPDGEWIAYGRFAADAPLNRRNLAIYLIHPDGSGKHRATASTDPMLNDIMPKFSPDSETLAFIRSGGSQYRSLMLHRISDGQEFPIKTDNWITSYDWHQDGRAILMTAHRNEMNQVELLDLAKHKIVDLGHRGATHIRFGENGQVFYQQVESDSEILVADLGQPTQSRQVIDLPGYDFDPSPSPDGKYLAFCSQSTGYNELYLLNLQNGERHQLTDHIGGGVMRPVWAPDSSRLIFLMRNDKSSIPYLTDLSTGEISSLPILQGENILDVAWSADMQWIYYTSDLEGKWQLWRMSLDGDQRQRLTDSVVTYIQNEQPNQSLLVTGVDGKGISRFNIKQLMLTELFDDVRVAGPGLWAFANGLIYSVQNPYSYGSAAKLQSIQLTNGVRRELELSGGVLNSIAFSGDAQSVYFDYLSTWQSSLFTAEIELASTNQPR